MWEGRHYAGVERESGAEMCIEEMGRDRRGETLAERLSQRCPGACAAGPMAISATTDPLSPAAPATTRPSRLTHAARH
jgi:hypothetical protein